METTQEERIAIINRIRKIRGRPEVAMLMLMWLLTESEAEALLDESDKIEG